MLVLSRLIGQRIIISDHGKVIATVALVAIRGDKIRLGFTGPGLEIDREEVFQKKQSLTQGAKL